MKPVIFSMLLALCLSACTNYGKKVTIDGSKGEVYYKGDGVTEVDAKKLCEYLSNVVHYFNKDKRETVQLTKATEEGYDVRFVVDEKKLKEHPEAADPYGQIGAAMSIDLYGNKPVNVFLTDTHFKDLKSMPFDKEVVNKLLEKMKPPVIEEPVTDTTAETNH